MPENTGDKVVDQLTKFGHPQKPFHQETLKRLAEISVERAAVGNVGSSVTAKTTSIEPDVIVTTDHDGNETKEYVYPKSKWN